MEGAPVGELWEGEADDPAREKDLEDGWASEPGPPEADPPEPGPLEPAAAGEVWRPTPVRKAMESPGGEGGEEGTGPRVLRVPGSGEAWTVTVTGRALGGVTPLRTVALMELCFSPVLDPQAPPCRVLRQESSLDDLSDEELLELLFPAMGTRERSRRGRPGRG
jgi:hypothetical protein